MPGSNLFKTSDEFQYIRKVYIAESEIFKTRQDSETVQQDFRIVGLTEGLASSSHLQVYRHSISNDEKLNA
jgi:hypothetical protein